MAKADHSQASTFYQLLKCFLKCLAEDAQRLDAGMTLVFSGNQVPRCRAGRRVLNHVIERLNVVGLLFLCLLVERPLGPIPAAFVMGAAGFCAKFKT